ncbi:MAG: Lrp/AsnC family transcriptional regulator [Steroidobacteraceae bacterium]
MDKIDRAILVELEEHGRVPFGEIAERVALSKTPCWTRVQKLTETGAIKGYRAVIDPNAIGLKLTAYVHVQIEFGCRTAFEGAVLAHPAIIECYTTAGHDDYLLQVMTGDVDRLDGLLREELSRLPGVQRFSTTICLKRIKGNGPITRAAALLEDTAARQR